MCIRNKFQKKKPPKLTRVLEYIGPELPSYIIFQCVCVCDPEAERERES